MKLLLPAIAFHLSVVAAVPVYRGAEGHGALTRGGLGGRVLLVTRLDDDPQRPQAGSLRWALMEKGPRIVRFGVAGAVTLEDRVIVKEPRLTLDGSTAPAPGICIRGGSLEFRNVHDIVLRHVTLRLGDRTVLRHNRENRRRRPAGSSGLDCITLKDCRRVLLDHCSLSWSCDEILGITRCREVTVQWCILSEPLGNPRLHPYGDRHAFCINASASTLSIHHCLFAHFVMRGPQFECNDMRAEDRHAVRMEAVNNVIFDFERSGSRYSLGVEAGEGTAEGKIFEFQFLDNLYIMDSPSRPAIEPITKHGRDAAVRVAILGNEILVAKGSQPTSAEGSLLSHKGLVPPMRTIPSRSEAFRDALPSVGQVPDRGRQLFSAPVPVRAQSVRDAAMHVLAEAGNNLHRDGVDARVIDDVLSLRFRKPLRSQDRVGGWPVLVKPCIATVLRHRSALLRAK